MLRKKEYTVEHIEKEYLGGLKLDLSSIDRGFAEAVEFYPECADKVKARSRMIIEKLISGYTEVDDGRTLHIVVTHGF